MLEIVDVGERALDLIEAYRLTRKQEADLELALVGSMALDDPEGWDLYR